MHPNLDWPFRRVAVIVRNDLDGHLCSLFMRRRSAVMAGSGAIGLAESRRVAGAYARCGIRSRGGSAGGAGGARHATVV